MKSLLFFMAITFSAASAQAQVTVAWANYPGGVSIAVDGSDNIYTAHWDYNPGGDITLTRWNAAGSIVWQVSYNNTDNSRHEVATWVETDTEGNILISGTIRSGYSNPVNAASLLMKYNPSGTLLWRRVYESDFDGSSTKKCLVDAQNNIYVLGLGHSGVGMVTKVKKFSSDGDPIWSYFDNAGIGAPINFKFTPDNNIVISARGIYGSINGYAKIDLAGNPIWSLAGVNSLTVGDAAGDGFGNTYVIHGEYVVTNAGSVVKKFSPTGALIWEKINTMSGFKVEVGSDQNPIISGFPTSGSSGAAFMKYNSNGAVLWQNLDADGPNLALLAHGQMRLDGQDAAYLAASIMTAMAVCKVNSDGSSAWTATMPTGYAAVLDFGTDNSVYVVGGTTARLVQDGVPIPPPIAAFAGSPTFGCAPLTVNFTDQSSGDIGSWAWNFGDGGTSTLKNPSHVYGSSGTYTVSLTVTGAGGSDVETKTNFISVSSSPTAAFTASPTSGTAPLTVNFTDQSTGLPTNWSWTFGDGGTATGKNPSHTYTAPGTYTVSLSASNSCGSNSLTKTNYITVTAAQQNALHVAEMAVTREVSGGKFRGKALIKVVNESGVAISGVTVKGKWSGAATGSATFTTGSNGWGQTVTKWAKTSSPYTFCVTSLAKAGYTYDSAANVVSCGKSDGTVWKALVNVASEDLLALEAETSEKILAINPNPFNPSTRLSFRLSEAAEVRLEIYNILGEKVVTLYNQILDAGTHSVVWDARDDFGQIVGAGTYLYRLNLNDEHVAIGKLLFIK